MGTFALTGNHLTCVFAAVRALADDVREEMAQLRVCEEDHVDSDCDLDNSGRGHGHSHGGHAHSHSVPRLHIFCGVDGHHGRWLT